MLIVFFLKLKAKGKVKVIKSYCYMSLTMLILQHLQFLLEAHVILVVYAQVAVNCFNPSKVKLYTKNVDLMSCTHVIVRAYGTGRTSSA